MEDRIQLILENRNKQHMSGTYIHNVYFFQSIFVSLPAMNNFFHITMPNHFGSFLCELLTYLKINKIYACSLMTFENVLYKVRIRYDLSFDVFHEFPSLSFLSKIWSVLKEKIEKKGKLKKQRNLTFCKHSRFLSFKSVNLR